MSMPSRTASGFLVVTVVALAAAAGAHVITSDSHPASRAVEARPAPRAVDARSLITVGRMTMGRPVPAGFVGLSMEFRGVEAYGGQNPRALNPVFEQLLRNLAPNQRPVLRIG